MKLLTEGKFGERRARNEGKPSLGVHLFRVTRSECATRSRMTAYAVQAYLCLPLLGQTLRSEMTEPTVSTTLPHAFSGWAVSFFGEDPHVWQ